MEAVWRAQNPELAASLDYAAGKIDAEQYRQLTGKYPAGYIPPASSGGGGGGSWEYAAWLLGDGNNSSNSGQSSIGDLSTRGEVARAASAAASRGDISYRQSRDVLNTLH